MPSIRDLATARVFVVGDMITDRWYSGYYSKIGGEGVPVFKITDIKDTGGGACHVLASLRALGCDATLFSSPYIPPMKLRFVGTSFRADDEKIQELTRTEAKELFVKMLDIKQPDVVIISDYAKGTCTPFLCQQIISWARNNNIKVVVDPKSTDWDKYRGASVVTPNETEYKGAGSYYGNVLVTCGSRGMMLFEEGLVPTEIEAKAREVYDVTGAGDTVIAVLAAALAVGFPLKTAACLANAAAGVVVGKRGTATCSLNELEINL
jgi:D-beta-D-heptose 7-phosphate kinase / D-beta-D-heptose 1-phosphate adenosyltransferase